MSGQGYPEGWKGYRLDHIMPVGIRILTQLAFMNLSRWNFPEIYDILLDFEASDRSLMNLFLSWKRLNGAMPHDRFTRLHPTLRCILTQRCAARP